MEAISQHTIPTNALRHRALRPILCITNTHNLYCGTFSSSGTPPTHAQVSSLSLSLHFQSFKPTKSIYEDTRSLPVLTS